MKCIPCHPYQPFPSTCPTASGLPKNYNFSQYPVSTHCLRYSIENPCSIRLGTDPSLCWNSHHTDLWLQCITALSLATICWPCSHCRATNHYPQNCPYRPHAIPAPTDRNRLANISAPAVNNIKLQISAPAVDNIQLQKDYPTSDNPPAIHVRTYLQPLSLSPPDLSILHQCDLCGADHSAKNCSNRGSST